MSYLHSPHIFQDLNIHGRSFFSCLHSPHIFFRVHSPYSYLVYTLQAHVTFKSFEFSEKFNFFHTYTLHTCFRIHSPYSYLVYTLQAHVRFKIFKFSQIIFSCLHSPHMFHGLLSIQLFGSHSPSRSYISKFYIVIVRRLEY